MSNRFKAKFSIKKGDAVVVITGDDKDVAKPRKVLEVYPEDSRVLVEGVNIVSRHSKPTAQNTKGGIVKKEAPIHISNVKLWDGKEATRVSRSRVDGKLVRVSKKSGQPIK
jgi:large subunit ribosomal protein L24